jgi:hypothetical protein
MEKRTRGRPRSENKLIAVKFCATGDQIETYKAAARADRAIALSEFVRRACDERAAQVLGTNEAVA